MRSDSSTKRSVTTAQAMKILAENGLEINEKQAKEILDLLYFLGKLTVDQALKNNKNVDIDQLSNRGKSIKKFEKVNNI